MPIRGQKPIVKQKPVKEQKPIVEQKPISIQRPPREQKPIVEQKPIWNKQPTVEQKFQNMEVLCVIYAPLFFFFSNTFIKPLFWGTWYFSGPSLGRYILFKDFHAIRRVRTNIFPEEREKWTSCANNPGFPPSSSARNVISHAFMDSEAQFMVRRKIELRSIISCFVCRAKKRQ
ncbi:unnamed protein product [Nesidiocoris tenuis]|uniref:Uncharacterized protein n=1 Tax=Nesidiocoris tenuis TaxID=355587 RepID=A0A6H5GM05_9HEMI|nr:unnamed protein product [Nesidiocoris tenuis]